MNLMMMNRFHKSFWEEKYLKFETGWDIGQIATPLKEYIDQLTDKTIKILIPGAGNGYEAAYLHLNGFSNTYVLDIAQQPLLNLQKRAPGFPEDHIIHGDFFEHQGDYDLIFEQTFFCALEPILRSKYIQSMHRLIKPGGKLVGLLFDFPLTETGPPFGGNKEEYIACFQKYFSIRILQRCYNSIKPRDERELFFIFDKN